MLRIGPHATAVFWADKNQTCAFIVILSWKPRYKKPGPPTTVCRESNHKKPRHTKIKVNADIGNCMDATEYINDNDNEKGDEDR